MTPKLAAAPQPIPDTPPEDANRRREGIACPQTAPACIMVVDDQPANLKLMEDILREQGYRVRSFPRGRLALTFARQEPPDLILLDVTMPEMSGFEVCRHLKSDPALAGLPVIFLSALSEPQDKLMGFRCGGVDYITKPFQVEEIQARVKTHLELHHAQQQLQRHTDHLEELVQARTRDLMEAQARLHFLDKAKSDFLRLISHELRTPLNGVLGVSQLLLEGLPANSEATELRDLFEQSRERILSITENALLLAQIQVEAERFPSQPVPLDTILRTAAAQSTMFAASRRVAIDPLPGCEAIVTGEESLLVKALQALVETAVKFSKPGETVEIASTSTPRGAVVRIQSASGRIPASTLARFFDIFSLGEGAPGSEIGLEPAVAHRIFTLYGGSVTAENREPVGIRLTATFVQG
ncbi:MAG TPA: hybrid sensor histidine kinase/response regulator [Bryobacteraceae bacterium]|nr:hybrid sensor histidine kinase/response regulator [Bryobacteraceae bacterium]